MLWTVDRIISSLSLNKNYNIRFSESLRCKKKTNDQGIQDNQYCRDEYCIKKHESCLILRELKE